jgi:hypothetical protein
METKGKGRQVAAAVCGAWVMDRLGCEKDESGWVVLLLYRFSWLK